MNSNNENPPKKPMTPEEIQAELLRQVTKRLRSLDGLYRLIEGKSLLNSFNLIKDDAKRIRIIEKITEHLAMKHRSRQSPDINYLRGLIVGGRE